LVRRTSREARHPQAATGKGATAVTVEARGNGDK
jgi:hypothetical protein